MPNGDLVLAFTLKQVDALGEKLILKDYLINQNYEITKENYFCKERCDALASALDLRTTEIAQLEAENTKHINREKHFNDRVAGLDLALSKERKKKNVWKFVTTGGLALGFLGGFLLAGG